MDDKIQLDYELAAVLLDTYGCDPQQLGYYDWVELVYRLRLFLRRNGAKAPPIGAIADKMCKDRRLTRREFCRRLECVAAPLLAADATLWRALCGSAPADVTVWDAAIYAARFLEGFGAS